MLRVVLAPRRQRDDVHVRSPAVRMAESMRAAMPNLSRHRNDPVLVAVGLAVRRERLARGLSQEALGLLAGVDRTFVGQVERAENNVAMLTLHKLCIAMEMNPSDLLRAAGL